MVLQPLVTFFQPDGQSIIQIEHIYSRTAVARTLMARLPRLFRTGS